MPKRYFYLICVFISFSFILQLGYLFLRKNQTQVGEFTDEIVILIDPGHGGEDGGAVSVLGDAESHINLAIALKLEQLLLFYGTEPILLRSEDISLHDPSAETIKEKKSSDLKNRVDLVNNYDNAFLLSIHQNSYTEEQYHGAQVFYNDIQGENNLFFSEQLQELLRIHLDSENTRVCKPIDSNIYLMNHITVPAVLVECGFLSNFSEAKLLATSDYQQSLACIMAVALKNIQLTTSTV